jgi:hypothetical protein
MNDYIKKEKKTNRIIQSAIKPWGKFIIVLWLVVSIPLYFLSGNISVFYIYALMIMIFAIPLMARDCVRELRKRRSRE